jgi:hypothetical protein
MPMYMQVNIRFYEGSLDDMFETFKCAHPECKGLIGRTKFGALKPDYVHALRDSPLNTCTCQQHENADRAKAGYHQDFVNID